MSARKSRASRKNPPPKSPGWTTWWERQSETAQHLIAALILMAVSFGFFAPIHFSSQNLIPGDTVRWMSMANAMISYEEATGEPALWAPNAFAGMPGYMIFYVDAVPQIDVVPNLLRSIIWPSSHFLVLLFGAYLLTFFLTGNKPASLFAAVAFGLTTYIPVLLTAGHNTKFVALAWAPWLLLAFVYALRSPSVRTGLLFAVALAMNLRADHVQITYYVLFIMGVWWIVEAVHTHRAGEGGRFWRSTAWLGAGSVVAFLMIAQPYLAQLEYKAFTIRGAAAGGAPGGMSWEYAMAWSQGFGELFTLVVADAYGGSQYYWGPKTFTGGPHYFGALTVALALILLWKRRDATTWALGVSGILMVLFSLGENLPLVNRAMFAYFPLFDAFRVPETWLAAVALVTSVLAGCALAELLGDERRDAWRKPAFATLGIMSVILVAMLLAPDIALDFEKPAERRQLFLQIQAQYPGISESDPAVQNAITQEINNRKEERRALFARDAQRSLFFLVAGMLVLFLFYRGKVPGWLGGMAFVVLILLDLGGVGRRYVRAEILTASDNAAEEVPETAFDSFILENIEAAGGSGHLRVLSFEFGQNPAVNARPTYFYESLGGYHGAKLRLYQDFLERILYDPATGALNPNALSMMNVRYVVGQRAVPGYDAVFQDDAGGNTVFENPDVLPRAFFISNVEVIPEADATWVRLQDGDFDPAVTALFHHQPDVQSAPIDSASVATARLISHSPREIIFDVETDADRWLVVSEVYYPAGWTATVDDQPAAIERADYLLRAVHVPEGRHRVRMQFEPASHVWGVRLSVLSTILVYGGLAALVFPNWVRRRRDQLGEPPT